MTPKVWLVTGCSSGLGNQLIQSIIARGDKAIATARNASALKTLADAGAATIELDVTASEDVLKEKVQEAIGKFGRIDVVVHNAGKFQMGSWEDLTQDLLQSQLQTNLFSVVNLTRALLPHFRERKDGTMVFIGSTSAWLAYGGVSAYGASKAALARMIDGLATEVGFFGIKVLSIDAGGFASQLVQKGPRHAPPSENYEQLMGGVKQGLQWMTEHPLVDVVKLASLIIDLVRSEGVAAGKEIPLRFPKGPKDLIEEWENMGPAEIPLFLPAGTDAIESVKGKCEAMLRAISQWEGIIKSTDVETTT